MPEPMLEVKSDGGPETRCEAAWPEWRHARRYSLKERAAVESFIDEAAVIEAAAEQPHARMGHGDTRPAAETPRFAAAHLRKRRNRKEKNDDGETSKPHNLYLRYADFLNTSMLSQA
jgi:hypothetical protein